MSTNTKERRDAILAAALALLEKRGIDVLDRVPIRELAPELAALVGCHPDTARRHLAKAARLMRGDKSKDTWGGNREGSGWTVGAPRSKDTRRAALLLQHSQHPRRSMWRVRAGTYGSGTILVEWGALDVTREQVIEQAQAWGLENSYTVVINEAWL
jgi:hypothetical protein